MSDSATAPAPEPSVGDRALARGITATWWYTVSGVLSFEILLMFMWALVLVQLNVPAEQIIIVAVGSILWCGSTVLLLLQYRHRDSTTGLIPQWRVTLVPILVAVAFGATGGIVSGLWTIAIAPIMQSVLLLNWQRGVRMRLTIVATIAMIALWFIDLRSMSTPDPTLGYGDAWGLAGVFSIMLPSMTVLSLWWWDVIVALNRARAAESHLAATQERLRMATDVHDLQGHHLQVIALQLELAERLMPTDQDAALAQLRLARTSVDDARQGTRDLATQFRSVPLRDEIANAVDLLRAAGTSTESTVDAAADAAPASVLGPVIRETTTNVLRHGAGEWARLSLTRADGAWRYEIANDRLPDAVDSADGAGLDGIARRTGEVGGTVEIDRGEREFSVVVIVPEQTR